MERGRTENLDSKLFISVSVDGQSDRMDKDREGNQDQSGNNTDKIPNGLQGIWKYYKILENAFETVIPHPCHCDDVTSSTDDPECHRTEKPDDPIPLS